MIAKILDVDGCCQLQFLCIAGKEDKQLAVIPEGPYVIPVYRPDKKSETDD